MAQAPTAAAAAAPGVFLRQARFERGLTFNEFVAAVMSEPQKAVKLKDMVALAGLMVGSKGFLNKGGANKGKQAQPDAGT
jgi:hypothetical protein